MSLSQPQLVELNSRMNQYFGLDEIQSLCFDMGIDFDILPGEGKMAKIRALIAFCQRQGRTDELVTKVSAKLRDVACWGHLPRRRPAAETNTNSPHTPRAAARQRRSSMSALPHRLQRAGLQFFASTSLCLKR